MKLIGCGDSWAWGAELVDKEKFPDWHFGIDQNRLPGESVYREKNRYLNLFAKKAGVTEIVSLAKFSLSNDAIVRLLINYLAKEGYLSGRDTSELFVSIGWTSPERREFYYKKPWSGADDHWLPFGPWPIGDPKTYPDLEKFRELFIDNFWNIGESMNRYIRQVWQTELMLKHFKIKYVMHQAFYHYHNQMIYEWDDRKYKENTQDKISEGDKILWHNIDPILYMNKDSSDQSTFHHYIVKAVGGDKDKVFAVWHPNELGHELWADYMYQYCKDHQLL